MKGVQPMKLSRNARGFTLVEIMIVVAIIGLLAAIAVPNFVQARQQAQTNACINNLRLIDAAKQQWAIVNGALPTAAPTVAQLDPYVKGTWVTNMLCPMDNTAAYDAGLNAVNVPPVCANFNVATHNAVVT